MGTNKMRDISREQFEDFWRDTHCEGDEELSAKWLKREGDEYLHLAPNQAFKIWQASREVVVVELPAEWATNVGKMLPPPGVRRAIEAQGLKVAP